MPAWGLVATALLAKGAAGSRAKRVPCAEQRDQQSHRGSCAGLRGARVLPKFFLRTIPFSGWGDKTLQKDTFPLASRLARHTALLVCSPVWEGAKPQRNVGAGARGGSQVLYPTARVGC